MLKMGSNRYFSICLYGLGVLFATGKISVAQVIPDNTVGTQVDTNGNVSEITGGETRGDNLFHSFQDFSVPTNNEAFFNNSNDVNNIFSRVTGGNVSNIDGLIRANGNASLFLINPAGIMFGENASLNLGGSFYGSTADSILFEDGEFSAANPDAEPLLTINAPIGLNFRNEPGDITGSQTTLQVNNGQDLFLIGGNLSFDGLTLGGLGSRIELGALTGSGIVAIDGNGNLNFPEAVTRGDISFSNSAQILVAGESGGSININARNSSITANSSFFAGIGVDSGSTDAQAGDVVINLTGDLALDNSQITNTNFGTGNAGNIIVDARNVFFSNGGIVSSFNTGKGNIGDVVITASENVVFDGVFGSRFSGLANSFTEEATGDIGEINLTAQNLDLTNGGAISSTVENNNNSGNINLNIADTIRIDGFGLVTFSDGTQSELSSSIDSNVAAGNGNSGNVNISTQNLLLNNRGFITAANSGQGNAGDINIDVDVLSITERARIIGDISGSGRGSNITINATETVSLIGNAEFFSFISADINRDATGEAGNIDINTAQLILEDAFISANVIGNGDGGAISISATNSVSVINNGEGFSFISADINEGATGEAGNIEINTAQLVLEDAIISADVIGDGNGGAIAISANDSIELSNLSIIRADVFEGSIGNSGNVNIETGRLNLSDGSQIGASTSGSGDAGNVTINANESVNLSGVSETSRGGIFANAIIEDGAGGNVNLTTGELTITDGAIVTASNFPSFGEESEVAPGTGEPGNIAIAAESLRLSDQGRIEAVTQAEIGQGANIDLQIADNIFLKGDSFISAEARGNANGGNLNINTNFIVAFDGNNDIIASAERGTGGNINITAESLLGIKERPLSPTTNDINASSEFGIDGNVSIGVLDLDSFEGATELSANVIEPGETTAQICNANGESTTQNSFAVTGKGGISPTPDLPLNSDDIITQPGSTSSNLPEPLKTSQGDIQPAMGVRVTESGVILTAYQTDNNGRRLINNNTSCGVRADRG